MSQDRRYREETESGRGRVVTAIFIMAAAVAIYFAANYIIDMFDEKYGDEEQVEDVLIEETQTGMGEQSAPVDNYSEPSAGNGSENDSDAGVPVEEAEKEQKPNSLRNSGNAIHMKNPL